MPCIVLEDARVADLTGRLHAQTSTVLGKHAHFVSPRVTADHLWLLPTKEFSEQCEALLCAEQARAQLCAHPTLGWLGQVLRLAVWVGPGNRIFWGLGPLSPIPPGGGIFRIVPIVGQGMTMFISQSCGIDGEITHSSCMVCHVLALFAV